MGLDMYLSGKKYYGYGAPVQNDDGFEIEEIHIKLGYWRKHNALHGYIVENFGPKDDDGKAIDNCEDIELNVENIGKIIEAVKNDDMTPTTGFFFGKAYDRHSKDPEEAKWGQDQYEEDLATFGKAIAYLALSGQPEHKCYYRSVIYRASW